MTLKFARVAALAATMSLANSTVFSAASDTFSLLIRALKTQGRLDILSRPQVQTLDNQSARVFVGQNFPIITTAVLPSRTMYTSSAAHISAISNWMRGPRVFWVIAD